MTEKAENTRKIILDTAMKHFLEYGYTGVSLRSIVKDAGLTTGAFYKYYPTKETLFDALVDPYVENIYRLYDGMLADFQSLSMEDQTQNMANTSAQGMERIIDYIYDNYDHFCLLLKCGDSGKYTDFLHKMVARESEASMVYLEKMRKRGSEIPEVDESLVHMIYTGYFSAVLQIIEHDIDRQTAKRNVHQIREFHMGGWERLWRISFPEKEQEL